MMSSGKTTLGKKLARFLNYRFFDLDKMIEADQGMDIPSLFSQKGEAHFREVESRILKSVEANAGLVVASGGGAPCFFDNMEFIKKTGVSIFLDVPASDLAQRIKNHGKDDRPILSGAVSIEAELSKKVEERRPFYEQADVTIRGITDVDTLLRLVKPLL
jgi:shikimate kinase